MSGIYLTKKHTALTFDDMLQSSRKDKFLSEFSKFPKDYDFLNQVLTIASICMQSDPIQCDSIDEFLAFLGIIYLPYVIKQRDNDPISPRVIWMRTHIQRNPRIILATQHKMLNAHIGSAFDLEFRGFLDKNCQFLLKLCRKPAKPKPASVPLVPSANLELQLVLVDRALEVKSKVRVSKEVEGKMKDKDDGEVLQKLSELAGSIKSVIEVVANGGTKIISNGSNSLEQPSKKRKEIPE
ncbi:hypothetical protein EAE96_006738 [Botrytis aclada]|nr:hypothetical protein EAE96_006738 [Botrytis aclada]